MAHIFTCTQHTTPLDDEVESINNVQQEHPYDDDAELCIQYNSNSNQQNINSFSVFISKFRIRRINFAYLSGRLKCKWDVKFKKRICTVVSILSLIVIVSVCISLGYYAVFVLKPAPVIDKSYRAFRIPNHKASLAYGKLQSAKKYNYKQVKFDSLLWIFNLTSGNKQASTTIGGTSSSRNTSIGYGEERNRYNFKSKFRRKRFSTFQTQFIPIWRMQVVFMTGPNENIFTPGRLKTIHDIEKRIVTKENYPNFCFKDSHLPIRNNSGIKALKDCAPLNSLLTYFFPSKDDQGNIRYDGIGENMGNLGSALKLAMQSTHFYYYVDEKVNKSYMISQLLRTEVLFGAPLNGFNDIYTRREEQNKIFKEFVVSYIDVLSKVSTEDVTVLYGGQEIFDYEVEMTFWCDVRLAFYAVIAIFLLMLILTSGSVWLTLWGLISILLSCLLAIFFYRVVFKIVGLGILNGAAAFVIIGIGVDDVFVFINVFCQADHEMDARSRILYTLKIAGKATFFTSFTTAAAFAANIASMIPAIHDFGLFMSLIVANCWITVVLVMPAVLYIWYICIRRCEERTVHFICCCLPTCKSFNLTLPADIANFLGHNRGIHNYANVPEPTMPMEDVADEPMLSMDVPLPLSEAAGNNDVDMLRLDQEPLLSPSVDVLQQNNHLGPKLQALLYYYMALPFIKARWFILGISLLLLGISIGLMTQLKPSTKPPQFFHKDTNMQRFMDLKSKFSSFDTLQCFDCSAMYSVGQFQQQDPYYPAQNVPQPASHRPDNNTPQPSDSPHPATLTKNNNLPVVTKPTEKPATSAKPLITTARQPTTDSPTLQPQAYPAYAWTKFHPSQNNAPRSTSSYIVTSEPISTPESVPVGYDACKNADCSHLKDRPLLELGTTVYVVVGLKDFKWSPIEVEHVISDDTGTVEFDPAFSSAFNFSNPSILKEMRHLCLLCMKIANNLQLVRNGSAQCLPDSILYQVKTILFELVPECAGLSAVNYIYGRQQPAHAIGGLTLDGSAIAWLGFAFESTTSKSLSYFEAYKHYQKWEDFMSDLKQDMEPTSPLQNIFQTSEFWPEVLMEVVAVNSAIYGIALSMVICMVAVAVFTRHLILLFIIFVSIVEMVCLVVALFYILGWEIGGVEAVSLSILVGSSVDYCIHLIEGYVLAADACPIKDNAVKARQWRTGATFNHVGISVISSALTTIVAAIPLTQTKIQPFAKFGQIIAINTSVCIIYSLTVCVALLSTIAPAYFKPTWKSTLKSFIGTAVFVGIAVLTLFIISKVGVDIPGPNGGRIFPK